MLTGIAGLIVPRRGYGWLRRRLVLRDGSRAPAAAADGVPERRFSRLLMPGGLAGTRSKLSKADAPATASVQQETIEEYIEE